MTLSNNIEVERGIIKTLVFNNCKERLISFLLSIAERFGEETDEGILIDTKMNTRELADFVGSKRQTVSTLIHCLINEGLIQKIGYTKYLIISIERLKQQMLH